MKQIKYDIINILPIQIFKFFYDDTEDLKNILNSLKQEKYVFVDTKFKSENFMIHKKEQYKKLFDWIHDCLIFVKETNKYECDSLKVTQSWANKYEVGNSIHPHIHPNSVVSGIFYANETNSGTIFGTTNAWKVGSFFNNFAFPSTICLSSDQECYNLERVEPELGCLYVFPSNLEHNTEVNNDIERYTISFNSFPSGRIGIDDALASLRIEVQ